MGQLHGWTAKISSWSHYLKERSLAMGSDFVKLVRNEYSGTSAQRAALLPFASLIRYARRR